jgi:hypothetical protein
MEALGRAGEFSPPALLTLKRALEYGLDCQRAAVFADLWNLETIRPLRCVWPLRSSEIGRDEFYAIELPVGMFPSRVVNAARRYFHQTVENMDNERELS